MGNTKIQWTQKAWNPVTGCTKVSAGCQHCYAERMAKRLAGRCGYLKAPNQFKVRLHYERLDEPFHWRKSYMVFVDSMGDLFHKDVPDNFIYATFAVMAINQEHTYQILTKRPARMLEWVSNNRVLPADKVPWPLPNVWLGVSAEDQKCADQRIPLLLKTPAALRFVSVEPMLGPVDLKEPLYGYPRQISLRTYFTHEMALDVGDISLEGSLFSDDEWEQTLPSLDWIICGGESGPHARPIHPDWVRLLRDQCVASSIPFFFKQWGAYIPKQQYGRRLPQGREWGTINIKGEYFKVTTPWNGRVGVEPDFEYVLFKVGKKEAGNALDGQVWDQMPEVTQ